MRRFCTILFFLIISNNLFAQSLQWAKAFTSTGTLYTSVGTSIKFDAAGNSYTTGQFEGTVDFDPGPGVFNLTSPGSGGETDIYISKLDAAGNFLWAKQINIQQR